MGKSAQVQEPSCAQMHNSTPANLQLTGVPNQCRIAMLQLCTTAHEESMKIAAITINKGGVGKTMLSRSLATAASASGLLVLILDMDTQQNSTNWRRRRPENLSMPIVQFTTENDLEETLRRARDAGCDLVLIDTPPGRSTEAPAAVEAADVMLIPCTSEIECFEGLAKSARLARAIETPAYVVPNFVRPGSRSEEEAIRGVVLAQKIPCAPVTIHEYTVHREGSLQGKTAQELQPDSKAAKEINELWKWLCTELHMSTRAPVHKVA